MALTGRSASKRLCIPGPAYLEAMTVHFPFQNTYAALPANFFARVAPTPVASPRLIKLNRPLAIHLGLDPDRLASPGRRRNPRRKTAARRRRPDRDGLCRPPVRSFRAAARRRPRHPARRGDRRRRRPPRHPAQGLGPTPFSRRGDGRAALGPVLREYIVSEAMAALGIPTTRSLAAVVTGESRDARDRCCPARC